MPKFVSLLAFFLVLALSAAHGWASDTNASEPPAPFTQNEPQHGFQSFDAMPELSPDSPPDSSARHPLLPGHSLKDIDQPPKGLFYHIVFAEGFEEIEVLRRGYSLEPINPTNTFSPDTRTIFIVFTVFKHIAPYQVFGRLYPEEVKGLEPTSIVDEDTILLAAVDESGYLQFFPPSGRWSPGTYRVEIYVGFEINPINRMGTMRMTVIPGSHDPPPGIEPGIHN